MMFTETQMLINNEIESLQDSDKISNFFANDDEYILK